MGDSQELRDLLDKRGEEYGPAWLITGQVVSNMKYEDAKIFDTIMAASYFYNWMMIQNKLHRALASPYKIDTWKDILGYAQLVVDHLEKERFSGLAAHVIHQGLVHETEDPLPSE